ncbi:MAG TPA: hypothetical protein VIY49_29540 [Bryobacteraceae bacterium]
MSSTNVNVGRSPAPIQSPMHTGASVGKPHDSGLPTMPWLSWFRQVDAFVASLAGLTISVFGTLAIGSNLGQVPAFVPSAKTFTQAVAMVTTAPTGAAIILTVTSGAYALFTVTIPAGSTQGSATAAAGVLASTPIEVNITQVGSTFPGANLTVVLT